MGVTRLRVTAAGLLLLLLVPLALLLVAVAVGAVRLLLTVVVCLTALYSEMLRGAAGRQQFGGNSHAGAVVVRMGVSH
jgi:hypothetical protein